MNKKIKITTAATVAFVCVLVSVMTSFALIDRSYRQRIADIEAVYRDKATKLEESYNQQTESLLGYYDRFTDLYYVDSAFRQLYVGDIDEELLTEYLFAGYTVGTGDKYAEYYTKEQMEELTADLEGEFSGIGVQVISNVEYMAIEIINVFPDSPAMAAGVKIGDLIVYVGEDRQSVAELGYTIAVNQIRGEIGTEAVFTVARGEGYTELVDFRVERAKVTNVSVMSHIYALDPTVGVIKISEFDGTTPSQFKAAVESLQSSGCTRLVIDVRYNPGGELQSVCSVLDYLLPEGPVIRTRDKSGEIKTEYTSDAVCLGMPINVIINGSSASAAELFASALKDYGVAEVIGEKSYGKGSVQSIITLASGAGLKLTTRLYYPPFSDNFDGEGVYPDVPAVLDESVADINPYKLTDAEDNVLAAAVGAFAE